MPELSFKRTSSSPCTLSLSSCYTQMRSFIKRKKNCFPSEWALAYNTFIRQERVERPRIHVFHLIISSHPLNNSMKQTVLQFYGWGSGGSITFTNTLEVMQIPSGGAGILARSSCGSHWGTFGSQDVQTIPEDPMFQDVEGNNHESIRHPKHGVSAPHPPYPTWE